MKRHLKVLVFLSLLLVLTCALASCKRNEVTASTTVYDISADFNLADGIMNCSQTVTYSNATGEELYELKFHLYPNAYREGAKYPAVSAERQRDAYVFGESWGGIDVTEVSCDSRQVNYEILGLDRDILTVTFAEPLAENETVKLNMTSTVTVPKNNSRFGEGITSVKLCHFYPVACVFENGEFDTSPYYCIGDPFYSDVANYFVEFSVSVDGAVASTGNVVEKTSSDGKTTHYMEAENVRDFAILYLQHGNVVSTTTGNTTVSYFSTGDHSPDITLSNAANCIKVFSELFGNYPYDSFDLVGTDFLYGGMEYPTLAYFSSRLSGEQREYVVAHEIAHQWWYGVVGTNGVKDAWLDEGLAEFSVALYYKHTGRDELYDKMISTAISNYNLTADALRAAGLPFDGRLTKSLSEFPTEAAYVTTAYDSGLLLQNHLYTLMGERAYLNSIRKFYKNNAYKNAGAAEFTACFIGAQQKVIESWLSGKAIVSAPTYVLIKETAA